MVQRMSDTFITIHHVISHIWLFNKNGHSPGLHKLWFSWLGKRLFEMCWFYIGIAQIDLDPPSFCQTGKLGKEVLQTILASPYTPPLSDNGQCIFVAGRLKTAVAPKTLIYSIFDANVAKNTTYTF